MRISDWSSDVCSSDLLAVGMDPEISGLENILIRGLFLGMTRKQMDARVDDIAAFTELGDYLAMPLRTYSTEIGRASCRERGWQYVTIPGASSSVKKKKTKITSTKENNHAKTDQ